jgi:hypothetical protein
MSSPTKFTLPIVMGQYNRSAAKEFSGVRRFRGTVLVLSSEATAIQVMMGITACSSWMLMVRD